MGLTDEESFPLEGAANGDGGGIDFVRVSAQSEGEVDAEGHEGREGDDLEDETGNHDVDARLLCVRVIGGGGEAAACALEDKREEVAADEEESIGPGLDSRGAFSIHDDDAGEAEVDGGCQESRAKSQTDKVSVIKLETFHIFLSGKLTGGTGRM